jgi:HEAT repeat protein
MKKRRKIWMVLALIVVVALGGWFLMPAKEEPKYEGKTVKEWFDAIDLNIQPVYDVDHLDLPPLNHDPSFYGIKALKKEAAPCLLQELKKSNSTFHNVVFSWLSRLSPGRFRSDDDRRRRVWSCFEQLGPDAADAIPELIEMAKDPRTPNRSNILAYLGLIHSKAEQTIPVLETFLISNDTNVVGLSIWSISRFGPLAKHAAPAMVSILETTTNIGLEADIADALLKIDPVAATKAGVN